MAYLFPLHRDKGKQRVSLDLLSCHHKNLLTLNLPSIFMRAEIYQMFPAKIKHFFLSLECLVGYECSVMRKTSEKAQLWMIFLFFFCEDKCNLIAS